MSRTYHVPVHMYKYIYINESRHTRATNLIEPHRSFFVWSRLRVTRPMPHSPPPTLAAAVTRSSAPWKALFAPFLLRRKKGVEEETGREGERAREWNRTTVQNWDGGGEALPPNTYVALSLSLEKYTLKTVPLTCIQYVSNILVCEQCVCTAHKPLHLWKEIYTYEKRPMSLQKYKMKTVVRI